MLFRNWWKRMMIKRASELHKRPLRRRRALVVERLEDRRFPADLRICGKQPRITKSEAILQLNFGGKSLRKLGRDATKGEQGCSWTFGSGRGVDLNQQPPGLELIVSRVVPVNYSKN